MSDGISRGILLAVVYKLRYKILSGRGRDHNEGELGPKGPSKLKFKTT
jgi:hypothetical protein